MAKPTKAQLAERTEAIASLRKILRPGDTVYTVLRHVARSGMSRSVGVITIHRGKRRADLNVLHPNWSVAAALGWRLGKGSAGDGIIVDGCGMDAGFHLVYCLGRILWPQGTPRPHGRRNGQPDSDGGYALKHRWL
jgi:hypothetical protein